MSSKDLNKTSSVDPSYIQLLDSRISKLEEDAAVARANGNTGSVPPKPKGNVRSTRSPQHDPIIMERFLNDMDGA